GIIRLEADGAVVGVNSLREAAEPEQNVAEVGQCGRQIRLQRDRLFLAFAGLVVTPQPEQRQAQVGMRFRRAAGDPDRTPQALFGLDTPPAVELANAEQAQRVEMVGNMLDDPRAEYAGLGEAARAIRGDRREQQAFGLLLELLLQPRVLERARTGFALQVET